MKNSTGKRSAAAFKLKPTMAFAGQATAGAFVGPRRDRLASTRRREPRRRARLRARTAAAAAPPTRNRSSSPASAAASRPRSRSRRTPTRSSKRSRRKTSASCPTRRIAESLARLPGVTTQRDKNGNATNVISIRGLGPDFNGYLLNGREQTSTGDSRADDLSVYPAELIAGATVYKTRRRQPDDGRPGRHDRQQADRSAVDARPRRRRQGEKTRPAAACPTSATATATR